MTAIVRRSPGDDQMSERWGVDSGQLGHSDVYLQVIEMERVGERPIARDKMEANYR
jgi:hypothetical protein